MSAGLESLTPLRPAAQQRLGYHFIGIGGCGMSGLALMLHQRGHQIIGSDACASAVTQRLEAAGITVHIGHDAACLRPGCDCVVVSAAVKEDNPELLAARQRGVRVIKYAQMLGELSRQVKTLAVAGTHGKSTTSGWLSYLLHQAGADPSFVIGADVSQLGRGSGAGAGDYLVVEACEYDRSFLNLTPHAAAILNIEADHLDYYRDLEEISGAFEAFAGHVASDGLLVTNADDPCVADLVTRHGGRAETFGLERLADWTAAGLHDEQGQGVFDLTYRGRSLGKLRLGLPGRHNVANALAVAALAHQAGLTDEQICAGLESFRGVGRRMTFRGCPQGITLLDDYAHHPTEIRVTLEAIQAHYQPERLWCVFQPHQHSRTRFLLDEFASSFQAANVVLLPDIYFVRDSAALRQEINAAALADAIARQGGQAHYLSDFPRIVAYLTKHVRPGDLVVTMGAGDVWKVADELICRFAGDRNVR